jgi:hypothetical protein
VGEESAPAAADATPETPGKSAQPRTLFAQDDPAMALARKLSKQILAIMPDACVPQTSAALQEWAQDFDLMLRRDKRSPPEVESVIDWALGDPFWCAVIRSARKFREHYDQLRLQRRRETHAAAGRRAQGNGRWAGDPPVGSDEYYAQARRRLAVRESAAGPDTGGGGPAA